MRTARAMDAVLSFPPLVLALTLGVVYTPTFARLTAKCCILEEGGEL